MSNKITRIEINIGPLPQIINKKIFEQSLKNEWYKIPQVADNAEIKINIMPFLTGTGTVRAYDKNRVLQLITNTYDYNHHVQYALDNI